MELQTRQLYEFGSFRLAPHERRLYRGGDAVSLPPKEFDLLLLLVRNAGQPLGRENLIKSIWPNTVVEEANLNVHVSALRKILSDSSSEQSYIETLPRLGYRFVAPVTTVDEPEPSPVLEQARTEPGPDLNVTVRKVASNPAEPLVSNQAARWRPQMALWLLALLAVGVLAFFTFKPPGAGPTKSAGATPVNVISLTSYAGNERQAAFSPDGNQIAFVWTGEKESHGDIYVRLVEGGNYVRVTEHPGDDINPVWSPTGRTLAFYRSAPEGDGVYLVPALGGAERKLTDAWANRFGIGSHTWVHWSPDDKWLVLSDKTAATDAFSLYLVSPTTGERRRLTTPPASIIGDCSPVFSPDGRQIAFVRVASAFLGEVYLVSIDGGEPKRLTFDAAGVNNLIWTAGGNEIIFASRQAGKSRLFKIPATGGTPEWIAAGGNEAQYPAFSPQSNRLAWTQNTDQHDVFKLALKEGVESVGTPVSLLASTASETSPRYSPDGKRIVFSSNSTGSEEIWVSDNKGENSRRLTSSRGPLTGSPAWSPDGKYITFDCRPNGNADIFIINSEGGEPRALTTDSAEDVVPSWSRDGRSIYFASTRNGHMQIWKQPVAGGEAIQITQQGGFEPQESPDGEWLYYNHERGSSAIWRVSVKGGAETQVFDSHQKTYTRMWLVTNDGIYYAAASAPTRTALNFFNLKTGQSKTITEIEGRLSNGLSGLTLQPDGSALLFPMIVRRGSDLMMIENYR
jgi:Tol biopolymer transport system component/DNA-binding winged helix-turn-helix (wHTH) protein